MKNIFITTFCCLILIEVSVCQTAKLTFPENLLIGVATSSYQIEGAWNISDKGENVWDWWTHNYPEYIVDGTNGDVACDSYNKYLEDVALIKEGTSDFFGLNHYSSAVPVFDPKEQFGVYTIDSGIIQLTGQNFTIGSLPTNYHEAEGFRNVLNKIRTSFGNPPISIYENGYYDPNGLNDYDRINYFHNYFSALLAAVKEDGCNVTRYTIWSLLDNFGWQTGYEQLLGITEVDFNDPGRKRTPKLSSRWWRESISRRELQPVPTNTSWIESSGQHNNEIPPTL